MADIKKSMELLKQVEHSNRNDKLLHKNDGEDGLTYFGIYESAHPNWKGWKIVKAYLDITPEIEECSKILANVSDLTAMVYDFYKKEFWDKARLDEVNSQEVADEIFLFSVNTGMSIAIKKAQRLVGVEADGDVGPKTLKALNDFDVETFDIGFDELEKAYYDAIIQAKPYLGINKNGWYNRASFI